MLEIEKYRQEIIDKEYKQIMKCLESKNNFIGMFKGFPLFKSNIKELIVAVFHVGKQFGETKKYYERSGKI